MAYRKTEKVLEHLAARRAAIVDAAVHVMAIGGADELRVGDVASRAGIAVGALYRYFTTREDLVAAAVARVLGDDVAAIREAAAAVSPRKGLAASLGVLVRRLTARPRVTKVMVAIPAYRLTLREVVEDLIKAVLPTLPSGEARILAAVTVGAIFEASGTLTAADAKNERTLVSIVLRAIGVSGHFARAQFDQPVEGVASRAHVADDD